MNLWFLKFYDRTGLVERDGVNLPGGSWFGPVPEPEAKACLEAMEKAEHSGELDGLFKGACRELRRMPDKGKFFDSLVSGMKLYKSTFLKIYGYDISNPGFADEALAKLKGLGCSKAEKYYNDIVSERKEERERMMKEAAAWYRKNSTREFAKGQKGGGESRDREIQSLTRSELTKLCKKLLQNGVIERPEQFVTAVNQGR